MDIKSTASERRRHRLHEIIFEADTPAGRAFDIVLLVLIVCSVLVVMLESIPSWSAEVRQLLVQLEWVFTVIFTIEYVFRLYACRQPGRYALSFYGLVDLLSILPSYLLVVFAGGQYFTLVRALRLLRIFRIFKLGKFLNEGQTLQRALLASRNKITIFLFSVLIIITLVGALMYLIEGGVNDNFTSIPRSVYWAIVTLTTVGYGDITPVTALGQFVSALVMILGYAIIAVPTGIVTTELVRHKAGDTLTTQVCPSCSKEGHDLDAIFCKYCGERLNLEE